MCDANLGVRESRDPIADIWGPRTPIGIGETWPVRVDEHVEGEVSRWVPSACLLCSNGCGMDIGVSAEDKIVGVRGRAGDRVNKGRLGPKGMLASGVNGHKERLTKPLIRREDGQQREASWDEAMELIVRKSKECIEKLSAHAIAFYTSGQLFLEEYHTLAVIGKGGLGTLNMDGNTRLCTATAAAAMRESFGCDGQPGSYTDIEHATCIMLVGHNMAATQTVLWARILDRLKGANPPDIICIDPRTTPVAEEATVHLRPRIGTNLCLLNGLLHLLFENDWIDHNYIEEHTVGVAELKEVVKKYEPAYVQEITGVAQQDLRKAAKILGSTEKLLSTVLQGVYQSWQSTSSACQINNINLVRGMIGKPGCGIFQMNGQPTAQNNREAGCDGEYPGFRNYQNPQHVADLADHWNVDVAQLAHFALPTHVSRMLDYVEHGLIKMLWISGTNPAVSLPNLARIRDVLGSEQLFIVAQDIFPTETTRFADVVLPAAMWGEKAGCFTNVDRTVHYSQKAVDPPGEAKSDLHIWLDYARRMDFRDKDDKPLIKWQNSEEAFEHWKSTTEGRPCDYTGLSYKKLSGLSGVQWPCNDQYPDGCERLYSDGIFPTDVDHAESWGHDHETGTPLTRPAYEKLNPAGRAVLKSCHYRPPPDTPDDDYPLRLSTGRILHHFHTRTKTGRSPRLAKAGGDAFVQINHEDALSARIEEGDLVLVTSRNGRVELPAKVGNIEKGQTFVPFHFGAWAQQSGDRARTANDLTMSSWDAISKQPFFKGGAVRIEKVEGGKVVAEQKMAKAIADVQRRGSKHTITGDKPRRRHIADVVGLWSAGAMELADVLKKSRRWMLDGAEPEVADGTTVVNSILGGAMSRLKPFVDRYGDDSLDHSQTDVLKLSGSLFADKPTSDPFTVMHWCLNVTVFCAMLTSQLSVMKPTSVAMHDNTFTEAVEFATTEIGRISSWAMGKATPVAAQVLIVPVRKDLSLLS